MDTSEFTPTELTTVETAPRGLTFGLTGSQIKWIALIIMTIDHVGGYAYEIPIVGEHYMLLRSIGRIAAPLFLFMLTESARYTRNRWLLIRRLYLGGLFVGLFVTFTNTFLYRAFQVRTAHSNIMYTFFFTVLFIQLLEGMGEAARQKSYGKVVGGVGIMTGAVMLPMLAILTIEPILYNLEIGYEPAIFLLDLMEALFPVVTNVEYGYVFVLLGVAMYFGGKTGRYGACAVYFFFCVLCWLAHRGIFVLAKPLYDFTGLQLRMVFALPIMLLYNGQPGRRGSKYFFYVYYPVHRYVLAVINRLVVGM